MPWHCLCEHLSHEDAAAECEACKIPKQEKVYPLWTRAFSKSDPDYKKYVGSGAKNEKRLLKRWVDKKMGN